MSFIFKKIKSNPNQFFDILPKDWQDDIVPFWEDYKDNASIYIIKENSQVEAGGIIFSTPSPDILYYKKEAQKWFDNKYLYIGFLWVNKNKRNNNLGSFWISELKKQLPNQKFWLLIEEERLHSFYLKNDFKLIKIFKKDDHSEWLYAYSTI